MMTSAAGSDMRDLVFISYSHADEPPWLGRLRIILKPYVARGRLEVWADPYIQVGDRWLREIRGALDRTKVAVFLVSPNFLASDFIQNEEIPPLMSAAEAGSVRIVAVPLRLVDVEVTPFAEFQWARDPEKPLDETVEEGLHERSRNGALVEVCKKIAEAARMAQTTEEGAAQTSLRLGKQASTAAITVSAQMGALHGVPAQKPNFVPREADLRRLQETLLNAGSGTVGIIGSRRKDSGHAVGLHGMGGIGKTELAIALVNNVEVRRAFPDGIFWFTLGQTPDLLRLQADLDRAACGTEATFADVTEGRRILCAHFADRAALIVLDDLWQAGDAAALAVAGPRGRVLTTTRDASLLTALAAEEISLDVLGEDLALQVLANWSGQDRGALSGAAKRVAKECGYLPLALSLAGAQVRDGLFWEEVLAALEQGDLEFLDHPYGSVFKSLRASIDALSRGEAVRYAELAVTLEDVPLPVATVCRLWRHTGGLQEHQSRKLMQAFAKKALLSLAGKGEAAKLSFHDLQHDFLRLNAEEPQAPHRALLDAYRQDLDAAAGASPGAWARLPKSEPYLWTWLADHLLAAGLQDELRAAAELLLDDGEAGSNQCCGTNRRLRPAAGRRGSEAGPWSAAALGAHPDEGHGPASRPTDGPPAGARTPEDCSPSRRDRKPSGAAVALSTNAVAQAARRAPHRRPCGFGVGVGGDARRDAGGLRLIGSYPAAVESWDRRRAALLRRQRGSRVGGGGDAGRD
jgi:hypothetical protein